MFTQLPREAILRKIDIPKARRRRHDQSVNGFTCRETEMISLHRMNSEIQQSARQTLDQLRQELLDQRNEVGHWVGRLSASALSTSTAVSAMSAVLTSGTGSTKERRMWSGCIERGIHYLHCQQKFDGGFGDTDRSYSNIATSYLALAASALAGQATGHSLDPPAVDSLKRYLQSAGEIAGLRTRYGKDKTFVVPILTNLAIAGLVSWDDVAALPFEAAVFPQSMYRWLQMPVVSYAIPALVAIGQARHFHGRKAIAPLRWIRAASINKTMRVLLQMQPQSGGYLEATPLTSFVVMSLASTGRGDHDVCRNGLRFLVQSMDEGGSWPIDTNLATWVTSLSVHALASDPNDQGDWCCESLVRWHLNCQHQQRHPFTGAEPGGWGWTDLSGAVPDSDDTPAAIIATRHFMQYTQGDLRQQCQDAIELAMQWLTKLQNRDGGWPTFCRGWGKLPFDRSSNDLTAHVIRAVLGDPSAVPDRSSQLVQRGVRFIKRNQLSDGSWLPLWFGNQDQQDETNPVYGTSRVLVAGALGALDAQTMQKGCDFLIRSQNADGGWGGGPGVADWLNLHDSLEQRGSSSDSRSSIEETALAIDALVAVRSFQRNLLSNFGVQSGCEDYKHKSYPDGQAAEHTGGGNDPHRQAIIRGVEFLVESVRQERHRIPWPIGFYFAKLWYHEELYPLIFSVTAIGKFLQATKDPEIAAWLSDSYTTTSDS